MSIRTHRPTRWCRLPAKSNAVTCPLLECVGPLVSRLATLANVPSMYLRTTKILSRLAQDQIEPPATAHKEARLLGSSLTIGQTR